MTPYLLIQDDCLDVLRQLPDNFVDAFVQDPPANIAFMGKGWDDFRRAHNPNDVGRDNAFGRLSRTAPEAGRTRGRDGGEAFIDYLTVRFSEELRVLKPGGHTLTWALPRTADWTTTALRRAGFKIGPDDFEIRDVLLRLFGGAELVEGFLDSLAPEQLSALAQLVESQMDPAVVYHLFGQGMGKGLRMERVLDAEDAKKWKDWRSQLRPAAEHWILAQKPTKLTIAENVLQWGVGALNIGGCRIPTDDDLNGGAYSGGTRPTSMAGLTGEAGGKGSIFEAGGGRLDPSAFVQPNGRYPTHVILDDGDAAATLDAQAGVRKSGKNTVIRKSSKGYGGNSTYGAENRAAGTPQIFYGDAGGASRYFFQAKPPRSEKTVKGAIANKHPTVKSVDLMRWLTRLVTPPGGLVVDPFMGSGSTGVACAKEGFRFLGIERGEAGSEVDHQYINTAQARVAHAYGDAMTDEDEIDNTEQLRPFVRWAGGKRHQATTIAAWALERLVPGARYIEPFLGGGAVALALPTGTPMILGDANASLGWLWWWVAQAPADVAAYAAGFGVERGDAWNTPEGYVAARIYYNTQPHDAEDFVPSARFLWLMHACFNGLYRENRAGMFNVPYGNRRAAVPSELHLKAIATRLQTADIRPGWDFEDVVDEAQPGDVVFADPPYDGDALAFTTYVANAFDGAAQERLAACLWRAIQRGVHVVTTNADTERVRKLYDGLTFEVVDERRSIAPTANGRGTTACVRITTR